MNSQNLYCITKQFRREWYLIVQKSEESKGFFYSGQLVHEEQADVNW